MKALGGAGGQNAADNLSARDADSARKAAEKAAPPAAEKEQNAGRQGGADKNMPDESRANVLAALIERHEKISNRIKRKP